MKKQRNGNSRSESRKDDKRSRGQGKGTHSHSSPHKKPHATDQRGSRLGFNKSYRVQHSERPSKEYMIRLFERSGLSLKDSEYDKLWRFHILLRSKNDELDLTRITRFEDYVIKHYVDCTIIPSLTDLPDSLLDIGTGPGFPGIPLKIVSPKTRIILGEPRWKRCMFMRDAIDQLGLNNIEVYDHKIFANFPYKVGGVITRAVESILKTLKRSLTFIELGGKAIFMKGPSAQPEVEEANRKMSKFYELTEDVNYTIKGTPQRRRLLVYTKIKSPPDELPD